jgi:ketosteroid isomerase-like protein
MIDDSILAAMQTTNDFFATTVVKGRDFAALDRVYTVDARILPPGADLIVGVEGIKGFWEMAVTGLNVQSASLATVDAHMAGENVVEIGRAELVLPEGVIVAVKYVVEWMQVDGLWKWHTDIWNMNA